MAGAYLGGLLARFIPGTVLLIGFALMMIATAVAMLKGRKNGVSTGPSHRLPVPKILTEGPVVGLVTGLVGTGGGFLVAPALALLGGLPMPIAVGTSLIVIAMKSFAGLGGYLSSVHIDWAVTLAVTAAAVVGSLIGAHPPAKVEPEALRKAFGWLVLAISSVILAQEIHPAVAWLRTGRMAQRNRSLQVDRPYRGCYEFPCAPVDFLNHLFRAGLTSPLEWPAHHWPAGTLRLTASMCIPQPDQVVLPQTRH